MWYDNNNVPYYYIQDHTKDTALDLVNLFGWECVMSFDSNFFVINHSSLSLENWFSWETHACYNFEILTLLNSGV